MHSDLEAAIEARTQLGAQIEATLDVLAYARNAAFDGGREGWEKSDRSSSSSNSSSRYQSGSNHPSERERGDCSSSNSNSNSSNSNSRSSKSGSGGISSSRDGKERDRSERNFLGGVFVGKVEEKSDDGYFSGNAFRSEGASPKKRATKGERFRGSGSIFEGNMPEMGSTDEADLQGESYGYTEDTGSGYSSKCQVGKGSKKCESSSSKNGIGGRRSRRIFILQGLNHGFDGGGDSRSGKELSGRVGKAGKGKGGNGEREEKGRPKKWSRKEVAFVY